LVRAAFGLAQPKAPTAFTHQLEKESVMARKYSRGASKKVESAMKKRKTGTLKSGRSGKKVKSRKQAIAIGLSEARRSGQKVPKKGKVSAKKTEKTKKTTKKTRKTRKTKRASR
jgi:hypothetical protein